MITYLNLAKKIKYVLSIAIEKAEKIAKTFLIQKDEFKHEMLASDIFTSVYINCYK